jgi:Flp pilus assembly protein TadG
MFRKDEGGTVVVVVALVLPAILIGTGGAIELTRAVTFRQQLASAVELSCRQAALYVNKRKYDDINNGISISTYPNEVASIAARNFKAKNFSDGEPPTAVNTDSNVHVEAQRTMPLIFARLLGTNSLSFSASQDCAVTPADKVTLNPDKPAVVFRESFEGNHDVAATGSGWGVFGGYNNKNSWNGWTTEGAGVEIDSQRAIAVSRVLFGAYFAELDSDCKTATNKGNQSCRSNSTLSHKLNARPGTYQIRYWYVSRKGDSSLGKKVICGSKDKDVAYYTKDDQTNRIEIYFNKLENRKGGQEIKYNVDDLIDVCVLSNEWTERVINVTVSTAGEYLFTWRAAGREDTYGGLIDNLRICENFCPAT